MPRQLLIDDREILEAALAGLQSELSRINAAMSDLRGRLGQRRGRPALAADGAQPGPRKRTISAAARKRIGEATKKRWAAFRAAKAEKEAPAKPRRKMSKAGRAAIVAATKKRWAEFRKQKTQAAKKPVAKKKTSAKIKPRRSALKGKARLLAVVPPVAVPVMP